MCFHDFGTFLILVINDQVNKLIWVHKFSKNINDILWGPFVIVDLNQSMKKIFGQKCDVFTKLCILCIFDNFKFDCICVHHSVQLLNDYPFLGIFSFGELPPLIVKLLKSISPKYKHWSKTSSSFDGFFLLMKHLFQVNAPFSTLSL